MKKANIVHPHSLHMLVSIQLTSISTELKFMTGALVVILRTHPSVMVNASGFWLDAVLFSLTYLNLVTISSATANSLLMHLSAMELISWCWDGQMQIIEAFGVSGVLCLSGQQWLTGCLLSTSEYSYSYNLRVLLAFAYLNNQLN